MKINPKKAMIIINGDIKTEKIEDCNYNRSTKKMDIIFSDNPQHTYSYLYGKVEQLKNPAVLNPNLVTLYEKGTKLCDVSAIYEFKGSKDTYYHVIFGDDTQKSFKGSKITVNRTDLLPDQSKSVAEYFKQAAWLSDLKNEETGERMLAKKYEKFSINKNGTAAAWYLDPDAKIIREEKKDQKEGEERLIPIFPFGVNSSQYEALTHALEDPISIIQGPPGTGKTQTILNIIANLIMQDKNVQIVSNNNAATENVYEKLKKNGFSFLAAPLGSAKNKAEFLNTQDGLYPDLTSWRLEETDLLSEIHIQSEKLKPYFAKKEELAALKQEYASLITEQQYFNQYKQDRKIDSQLVKRRSFKQWQALWQEYQRKMESKGKPGMFFRLKAFLLFGIRSGKGMDSAQISTSIQSMCYERRAEELRAQIESLSEDINSENPVQTVTELSMAALKDKLSRKYENKMERLLFSESNLRDNWQDFLNEYPVVLSTTFSSRNSLHESAVFDYVIMDEASQADIVTGVLALSSAKNAVIVGDVKQLPHVVKGHIKDTAEAIFADFHIKEGYHFKKSFLQSVTEILPDVKTTLLREHYRCHPKIIGFCNQKFYNGRLVIMTEDKGEKEVLTTIKTVPGNHVRDHYSQRQIDVIIKEVLPGITDKKNIGIISPYNNQTEELTKQVTGIDSATVHKFQGREKDTIIISTVDDEITDFSDDPFLLNVAVSRAKNKLILVTTGNEQARKGNISDLIDYMAYQNFDIADSKVYSVFDYLYKQYEKDRILYLQKHKRISGYDSENLMYALLEDILSEEKYGSFSVICHFPTNMVFKDIGILNDAELAYMKNPATHLDFLIYSRISKKPVLAIEVDGYTYHREKTRQERRDRMKDHIAKAYGLPLLRFKTNGSGEKEKIIKKLNELTG